MLAKLQADYAAKTGIKSLKIQYNQVFGYFVEVGPASAAALQAETARVRLPAQADACQCRALHDR